MFFCLTMAMAKDARVSTRKLKEPKNTKAPGSIQPLSKAEVAPEEVGLGVGALGFGLFKLQNR